MEIDPVVLYRYTNWANDRVIAGAKQLSPVQLNSPIRPGFHSVLGLLVHIMSAERIWLSRWQGKSSPVLPAGEEIATLDVLEKMWTPLRGEVLEFVAAVKDAHEVVVYRNTKGVEFQNVLWHLLLHVVNHGTEHRSQAALYLAMQGIDLGNLDLIHYIREGI